jgi:hypothetical protein
MAKPLTFINQLTKKPSLSFGGLKAQDDEVKNLKENFTQVSQIIASLK